MRTIAELYGIEPREDCFGVEIELEGCGLPQADQTDVRYRITEDASLRNNGKEFVTEILEYGPRLTHLQEIINDIGKVYPLAQASFRAGIHVHMNVSDMTSPELGAFLALYYLVEPVLYRHTGDRSCNHFCVPLRGSGAAERILSLYRGDDEGIEQVRRSTGKYAGLNLLPVSSFGSVEIRIMPSDFWQDRKLFDLIHVLFKMKWMAGALHKTFTQHVWDINYSSCYERVLLDIFKAPDNRMYLDVALDEANKQAIKSGVFQFKTRNPKGN